MPCDQGAGPTSGCWAECERVDLGIRLPSLFDKICTNYDVYILCYRSVLVI